MDMLSIHSTPLDTALNVYPHVFTEWMDMKSTTFILYRARHECVQWVSIITHKFMKQENLRRSHIFINGFSLCFFLLSFYYQRNNLECSTLNFGVNQNCDDIQTKFTTYHWEFDGEKWRVIIYLQKGSVNCRQNFNVKNNILLEANLFL